MSTSRFIPARGRAGGVCLRDTMRGNRIVCFFDRDWQTFGYRTERADAAAMLMAETCAEALNAKHEAVMQAKQAEAAQ